MFLKIDFNSDEAIYIQLRNQIIMGIATDMIREGGILCPLSVKWLIISASTCIQLIRHILCFARKGL